MNKNELLEYLKKTIYDSKGRLNSNILNVKKDYLTSLLTPYTSFLNNAVSLSERLYCFLNNIKETQKCKNCQEKEVKFYRFSEGYRDYCCNKCATSSNERNQKIEETNIRKYGTKNVMQNKEIQQKAQNTSEQKYGTKFHITSKEVQEKIKKTNLEKYNVENYYQSEESKKKLKENNLAKYNVEHHFQSNKVKEQIKKTKFEKTGYENNLLIPEQKAKNLEKFRKIQYEKLKNLERFVPCFNEDEYQFKTSYGIKYKFKCKKCNKEFLYISKTLNSIKRTLKCPSCDRIGKKTENEINNFIQSLGITNIIENDRTILKEDSKRPKEIDIYLPDYNFGIEYHGLMWHSYGMAKQTCFNNYLKEPETKNRHYEKSELADKNNIQIIQIFENEWKNKEEIVKSIIKAKLGKIENKIYARNSEIKKIDNKTAKDFYDKNHIQGNIISKINLALYLKDEIICMLSFSKPRFNKNYEYEITRFCNKLDTNVIGGFSKLLKYFVNNFNPQSIITYADRRYSNGNLYSNNDFNLVNKSKPNYFYFHFDEEKAQISDLFSRNYFQKHKLKDKLEKFDENLTETQNMYLNGYRKIYDSGNLVFELIV